MADTYRVDVKNVSNGPRMFNGIPPVAIPAGQSFQDIEVSAAELKSMRRFGEFEITGGPAAGPSDDLPALSGKNKAELLQIAKDEGAEVEDGATNEDIRSAIELHREG